MDVTPKDAQPFLLMSKRHHFEIVHKTHSIILVISYQCFNYLHLSWKFVLKVSESQNC